MKPWLPPLLVIGALAGLALWAKQRQAEPSEVQVIPCVYPVTGCAFVHHGQPSRLRFSVVPRPLVAFDIELRAPAAAKASVQFQMSGMQMGLNRYEMKAQSAGLFKASAILLPVCTQARTDWLALFTLDDTSYQVSFQTR